MILATIPAPRPAIPTPTVTVTTHAARMRVERCIGDNGYLPGWIVIADDGYCIHEDHDLAFACAWHRATELHHGG